MLRTQQSSLRPIWSLTHMALTRAVAAYLRRGYSASAYLRGSFAFGEPVFGLSDVDLVLVAAGDPTRPGEARNAIRRRWQRLSQRLPSLAGLISVATYEEAELLNATASSWLTYGLDGRHAGRGSVYVEREMEDDELGLRLRPELYGPTRDWQIFAGRDRRPAVPPPSGRERWGPAWLELQWWWRLAFVGVTQPDARSAAYLCLKLVAEPARIWLWAAHGERVRARKQALERALRRLPEEEPALRMALSIHERLRPSPDPPFRQVLAFLVRMSSRLARLLEAEAGDGDEVRLVSGDGDDAETQGVVPLVDWRGLALPSYEPDEWFALIDGDASDPETLARAAVVGPDPPYPVLRADGLMLFPEADLWGRPVLRAVQCAATDPVSFALAEGRTVARFTDLPGWSAFDSARRAVAEHRGWLAFEGAQAEPTLDTLAELFRAVRAALFYDTLAAGRPELPLTAGATATVVAARGRTARTVAEDAYGSYRACMTEDREPDPNAVTALRDLAFALPAYADLRSSAASSQRPA